MKNDFLLKEGKYIRLISNRCWRGLEVRSCLTSGLVWPSILFLRFPNYLKTLLVILQQVPDNSMTPNRIQLLSPFYHLNVQSNEHGAKDLACRGGLKTSPNAFVTLAEFALSDPATTVSSGRHALTPSASASNKRCMFCGELPTVDTVLGSLGSHPSIRLSVFSVR